jgi:hypothetical protein
VRSEADCSGRRVRSALASTDGTACIQQRVECGAAIAAIAGADMQVTVVRERSLLSRFARSAPTQASPGVCGRRLWWLDAR